MNSNLPNTTGFRATLRLGFAAVLAAASATLLPAQTVAPQPKTAETPAEKLSPEIVELSPFVIEAAQETGWVATQTLAGSRMRTDFKDLAQPIEVMTKDFLDDLGVNNYEQAIYYSTNIEGPNDHVDNTNDGGSGFGVNQPKNNTIVRGLNNATVSHDFFQSSMPTDNYNIDRLTIARGPNSILFGTGSPAGIIDASLKRANLRKNSAQVQLQYTSNDSKRASVDINRVILKDKLALHVDTMTDQGLGFIKPNLDRQSRIYGAITAQPFKKTTVTVTYENVDWHSNRASGVLPVDSYSSWLNANTIAGNLYTTARPFFDNRITGSSNPGSFTVANVGAAANPNPIFSRGGGVPVMLFGTSGNLDGNIQSWNNSVTVNQYQNIPTAYNWLNSFDRFSFGAFNNSPVPYNTNIAGTSSMLNMKSDTWNLFFQQQILKNLFFEFAWNHQGYYETSATAGFNPAVIMVDANQYMPNQVVSNPNAGRYYVQGRATGTQSEEGRNDYRGTLSYELDLSNKGGWVGKWVLGKIRAAGLISQENFRRRAEQNQRGILESPTLPGVMYRSATSTTVPTGLTALPQGSVGAVTGTGIRNWATDTSRDFNTRFYLGGPAGNATFNPFPDLFKTWNFTDASGNPYGAYMFDTPYTTAEGWPLMRSGSGPEGAKTRNDTRMISLQDFILDNRVVLLYGYRKDTAKSATINPKYQVRDWSGLYPSWRVTDFGPWGVAQAGITRTYGVVGRITPWLSGTFNRSDTFQPNIGKFDPFGNEYPGATGEATDYGISLNLFKDTLRLRVSHYENTSGPTRGGNTGYNDPTRDNLYNIDNQMLLLDPSMPSINIGSGGYRDKGRANYWVMLDSQAKGYELDLSWQPNRQWSIILNAAKNQSVQTNIGTPWFKWMNARLPVWQSLNVPEGGRTNPRDVDGDGNIGTWTWATAPYTGVNGAKTFQQYYEQDVTSAMAWLQAVDGLSLDQGRELRANLVVERHFTEGCLNGLITNISFRYRGAPNLGYGTYIGPGNTLTYDVTKPIMGLATVNTDIGVIYNGRVKAFKGFAESLNGLRYRVQLNVRNAFNEWTFVPVKALTTGPYERFLRAQPRTYILTFTFDY